MRSEFNEPFNAEFDSTPPYQIMPCYNTRRQKQYQTQQQPMNPSQNTQQTPNQNPNTTPNPVPGPIIDLGIQYTQGYLKTQIGKRMRITFLLGTNIIQDRQGTLATVGISYIVINDLDATTSTLCDIYSIKFVTIFP